MKYLKKFETEAEYIAYNNSENFITPNVSYVVSTNTVYITRREIIYDTHVIFEVTDGVFEVTEGTFEVLR